MEGAGLKLKYHYMAIRTYQNVLESFAKRFGWEKNGIRSGPVDQAARALAAPPHKCARSRRALALTVTVQLSRYRKELDDTTQKTCEF